MVARAAARPRVEPPARAALWARVAQSPPGGQARAAGRADMSIRAVRLGRGALRPPAARPVRAARPASAARPLPAARPVRAARRAGRARPGPEEVRGGPRWRTRVLATWLPAGARRLTAWRGR